MFPGTGSHVLRVTGVMCFQVPVLLSTSSHVLIHSGNHQVAIYLVSCVDGYIESCILGTLSHVLLGILESCVLGYLDSCVSWSHVLTSSLMQYKSKQILKIKMKAKAFFLQNTPIPKLLQQGS